MYSGVWLKLVHMSNDLTQRNQVPTDIRHGEHTPLIEDMLSDAVVAWRYLLLERPGRAAQVVARKNGLSRRSRVRLFVRYADPLHGLRMQHNYPYVSFSA